MCARVCARTRVCVGLGVCAARWMLIQQGGSVCCMTRPVWPAATHTQQHTHTPCCSYGRTSRCDCNEMKRARIDSVHEVSALFSCWNMTRLCPKATREVTRRLSFRPSSSRVKRSGYRIQRAACTACGPSCRQSLRQNESEVTAGDVDTSEYVLPLPISLCL